ncbi:MAG: OmpH family outer membrane protein [Paracoccus denitrificans]|uniref:OmpH family outer membrane protein n=1 Tax=Paracoccus denitrificans TaxID=266 RepID=A0A533I7G7_PARDE|nr:MAG: OmpH family outer membrane protein [Paracoccus denitrificans]
MRIRDLPGRHLLGRAYLGIALTAFPCAAMAQGDLPVIAQVQAQTQGDNPVTPPRDLLPDPAGGTTASRGPDEQATDQQSSVLAVLVLDVEQAYASSAWGKRAQADIETLAREIEAENLRMEDQLVAEEQALAAERASLSAADFRKKAEAFDTRAQTVRRDRRQSAVDLGSRAQADRNAFVEATLPVIAGIMQERSAGIVLDRRQVLAAVNGVDVTRELVARMDEQVGDGGQLPELPPAEDGSADDQTATGTAPPADPER